jgi:hypothetical protein
MDEKEIDRGGLARRWSTDLELAKKTDKDFLAAGRKIVKRYRDERGLSDSARKYNILWSNVQTLAPAVYSKRPKAEVSRRFKDADPVGRTASEVLERALQFEIDHYSDFDSGLRNSVQDRLLPGRGVVWIRFEPAEDAGVPDAQVTDDADAKSMGAYECSPVDYVFWEDFRTSPARTWEEVSWVARLVYMSRDEGMKRFGDIFKDVPLSHEPIGIDEMKSNGASADQLDRMKKAKVWEIWDKSEKVVYWHAEGAQEILDVRPDPLELEGFFPCPKPLYASLTTDTLIPVADFRQYQDQAKEMDEITERISLLVRAVKVVGVYDSSQQGVQRMLDEGVDNQLIPVSTWAMFAEKGGLKGTVDFLPVDAVLQALAALYQARDQSKQVIYEITGLSDIIRGASVASETATAQQIKSQFASLRLKHIQMDVARMASDILRMKAQIMCSMYRPEVLVKMSSMETSKDAALLPQAIELLRNDVVRSFRISVASDSMVELDEAQEKADRLEFLTAAGGFIREAVQAPTELAPLLGEMLMFGVRSFKAGQGMEASLEQFISASAEKAKETKPEPPPDPEMLKLQAQQQVEQGRMQIEQAKMQATQQADQMRLQSDMQLAQFKAQIDAQVEQMKAEQAATAEAQRLEFDRWKAELDAATKIQVAQIGAQTAMDTASLSAQTSAANQITEELAPDTSVLDAITAISEKVDAIHNYATAPKKIVRDNTGRAVGIDVGGVVKPITRGVDGRMEGL